MTMFALVAVGMMLLQVGRATIFSTEAQTAADAAALAGAKNVQQQLMAQMALTGTANPELVNDALVFAAAEVYAKRNGAHITRLDRRGVDVRVWVSTDETLGRGAESLGKEGTRGNARARARIEISLGGLVIAGNIGSLVGGGDPTIKAKEWKELGKEISDPPTCGTDAGSNDLVKLADLLREHGFTVGENADVGDFPDQNVHVEGSWHYRCHESGAIDVNHDSGDEKAAIDALVEPLHELGFRTIWQAAGHYDHIHIDVAASGLSMGLGGLGGAALGIGPLEDALLEVKLVDWDEALLPFYGFGGGGGFFSGPPDPGVARTICSVLDQYNAPPKVRLSAFEAAIVESGVHNLNYGDRDSLGVFQQRPSQGWGSPAQVMNPQYASMKFITNAIAMNGGQSAGQLAQDVQRSAYPYRYDAVAQQAYSLHVKFCGDAP